MERALSTHLFVGERLSVSTLRRIEEAGLPSLEIFCAKQHFDYTNQDQVRELGAWFRDHNLKLRSLHAPLYSDYAWGRSGSHSHSGVNIAETERRRRLDSVDEIKRALEVAETIPFQYIVQHLGVPDEEYSQKKFDAAYSSLEPLSIFAKQRGVQILLENIPNDLSTPARLRQFIDYTHMTDLRVCFDTGHAHMDGKGGEPGGVSDAFDSVRDLVVSTHIHDNRGARDDHLFPFQGTIDWEKTLATLSAADADFPLQLELRDYGEFPDPLEKALETFQRLEKLLPAQASKTT